MKRKPTIAIFTTIQGHLSIAQAIQEKIAKKYNVEVLVERDDLFDFYVPMYHFFPGAMSIPFKLSQHQRTQKMFRNIVKMRYDEKVAAFIEKHQPDLVMSCYFMFNPSLEHVKKINGTPFINVVPDPRTFHPLFISESASTNLLFDKESVETAKQMIPEAKYTKTGWFVRDAFLQPLKTEEIRRELGLDPNTLTFLVTSGSEGTTMVMKLLPALLNVKNALQLVVACGNNAKMVKAIHSFNALLKKMNRPVSITALGFIDNLHEYIAASDLVIGKAGPNTLFESIALQRPFLATTHIAGQETGNLDIIKDYQLGFVEENPLKAQKLLQTLVDDPTQLDQFTKPVAKLAQSNQQAGEIIHKEIEKLLKV